MSQLPVPAVANHTELWRLQQLALVSQVATQVTSIYNLDELLLRVVSLIYQTFEFYGVSLYTLEPDGLLELKAQAGPRGQAATPTEAYRPKERIEVLPGDGITGWVAQHHQELVVRDVSSEARFWYSPEFPHTLAEVALPLKVEDTLLGVLDVQLDYPEDFDESDMLVLRALAGQVSMAIEDTRLYEQARRRGDYLASISAVSWAIASILDVDRLLPQVCDLIRHYFEYPFVQVFTVQYGRRQIVYRAGSGQRAELLKAKTLHAYSLDDPQGFIPLVARTGQSILANDVMTVPVYRPSEILPTATRSELAVPLIFNDEVLGVLDVQSDKTGAFSQDDQETLETLAANIAVALRNANLYHSEHWRRQVADSLRRISGVLITDVDLMTIFDSILTEIKRNLPADLLAIWLIQNKKLELRTVLGMKSALGQRRLHLPEDKELSYVELLPKLEPGQHPWLKKGLKATEPLIRQDDDPSDPLAEYMGYPLDHSAIVAPLRVQNRVLGLLTLAQPEPNRYGLEALAVTSAFANQAAIAIENSRLFRLAQAEAQINSALLKVAELNQGFGELSEVLAAVIQIPPLLAEVDRCAIWLRHPMAQAFKPEAAYGFEPAQVQFFEQTDLPPHKVRVAQRLNQTRAPIIITDAPHDQRLPANLVAGLGLRTLVLLPLVAHGEMLGIMLVTFTNPAALREESIRLVTGVAHQAALAIESKYLYEQRAKQERLARELELAHEIQSKLIPAQVPNPPGWELAAFWWPAQEMSGDFYDFIEVAPYQLGLVIADVAGKGLPAALYVAQTRSLLRAIAPGQTDPRPVLEQVNRLLVPDTQRGMFVSLFYALLNIQTGALTFSNAGHNPPLLIRADGSIEALNLRGLVLGVKPEIEPGVDQRYLGPGDGVVFYTDGVTEVFDASAAAFGEDRLKEILTEHWPEGPATLINRIRQGVNAFSATANPTDDFTLFILRRK
jgi:serine phosphatase RsbU (regulator of sigma subunit)/putative methionine-R-sulfoxide reductase with GAF domain